MRTPAANPLITKSDLQQAFLDLESPLLKDWDDNASGPTVGLYRARYGMLTTRLETLSRYLWALAPFTAGGGTSRGWPHVLDAISHGTDPRHPHYWGAPTNTDQRSVEMAAMGFALRIVPEKIWEPLSAEQKNNFANWLISMLDKDLVKSNWQFFRLMTTMGLRHIGRAPANVDQIEQKAIDEIEKLYMTNGWYNDGGQRDYYIPWAFHFYSMLAMRFCTEGPIVKRLPEWKERAKVYADSHLYWFSNDGAALPFGRSLTYRFAQAAFWGGCGVASLDGLSAGVQKGILLRNLRWWWSQPFLMPDGYISLGYSYPNIIMCEPYNAQGSVYWAFKAFAPLLLDESDSFWKSQEEALPKLPDRNIQPEAHMTLDRDQSSGHVIAHCAGQWHGWALRHRDAKYGKFAYSTYFGPTMGNNHDWLAGAGIDNSIAVQISDNLTEDGRLWQCHGLSTNHKIEKEYLVSDWKSIPGIDIRTWVIPMNAWQIRVHRIITDKTIQLAEGGFAADDPEKMIENNQAVAVKDSRGGVSGMLNLLGDRRGSINLIEPNSSLYHSCVRGPIFVSKHEAGTHWIASAILGAAPGSKFSWDNQPIVTIKPDDSITVQLGNWNVSVSLKS